MIKKMRKTIYILVTLVCASCFNACDFLEEIPSTELVKENVYEDEEAAYSALLGCYRTLFDLTHNSIINGVHGASILRGHGSKAAQLSWYKHTLFSTHGSNQLAYQKIFGAVAKINTFLDGKIGRAHV